MFLVLNFDWIFRIYVWCFILSGCLDEISFIVFGIVFFIGWTCWSTTLQMALLQFNLCQVDTSVQWASSVSMCQINYYKMEYSGSKTDYIKDNRIKVTAKVDRSVLFLLCPFKWRSLCYDWHFEIEDRYMYNWYVSHFKLVSLFYFSIHYFF